MSSVEKEIKNRSKAERGRYQMTTGRNRDHSLCRERAVLKKRGMERLDHPNRAPRERLTKTIERSYSFTWMELLCSIDIFPRGTKGERGRKQLTKKGAGVSLTLDEEVARKRGGGGLRTKINEAPPQVSPR